VVERIVFHYFSKQSETNLPADIDSDLASNHA